jgi:homoserine kinase
VADSLPAVPFALVPEATVSTTEARSSLPDAVPHEDAAFTAGRAALLGAAIVQGSAELFAEAIQDRLHEPYRAENAPLLEKARADLPHGAVGATLSGSGPSVIVWVRRDAADSCEEELARRFADASVLRFTVSEQGAHQA